MAGVFVEAVPRHTAARAGPRRVKLTIAAIGRLKDGAERELMERYVGRCSAPGRNLGIGPLAVVEFPESRRFGADERKSEEAARLLAAVTTVPRRIALDERGKLATSAAFAASIAAWRDAGDSGVAFLIGGPDGHGEAVLASATDRLSLGPMTLPHGLARVILAEQIYRAITILSGHPYHRA